MPCDTVREIGVEFGNANIELLIKAMEELKLMPKLQSGEVAFSKGRFSIREGKFYVRPGNEEVVTEIRRQYGGEIVKAQFKRMGWKMEKQKETNKYVFIKA